jgi:hypothetical protein
MEKAPETQAEVKEVALAENQVKLSDGRIVTLREATGSTEMIVAAYLGDQYTPDTAGSVILMCCLVVYSIEKINEEKAPTLRKFEDFRDLMDSFRKVDFNKIRSLYYKMNSDAEGNV